MRKRLLKYMGKRVKIIKYSEDIGKGGETGVGETSNLLNYFVWMDDRTRTARCGNYWDKEQTGSCGGLWSTTSWSSLEIVSSIAESDSIEIYTPIHTSGTTIFQNITILMFGHWNNDVWLKVQRIEKYSQVEQLSPPRRSTLESVPKYLDTIPNNPSSSWEFISLLIFSFCSNLS